MKINGADSADTILTPIQKINELKFDDGELEKDILKMSDIEKAALPVSDRTVIDSVKRVNKALEGLSQTYLEFSIHEKTKAVMIKIKDKDTKEVIKEIPPEKMQDMIARLIELSGIFVDEKR